MYEVREPEQGLVCGMHSVVVFRGRHIGDPQSMTGEEHAAIWTEVGIVGIGRSSHTIVWTKPDA